MTAPALMLFFFAPRRILAQYLAIIPQKGTQPFRDCPVGKLPAFPAVPNATPRRGPKLASSAQRTAADFRHGDASPDRGVFFKELFRNEHVQLFQYLPLFIAAPLRPDFAC